MKQIITTFTQPDFTKKPSYSKMKITLAIRKKIRGDIIPSSVRFVRKPSIKKIKRKK